MRVASPGGLLSHTDYPCGSSSCIPRELVPHGMPRLGYRLRAIIPYGLFTACEVSTVLSSHMGYNPVWSYRSLPRFIRSGVVNRGTKTYKYIDSIAT